METTEIIAALRVAATVDPHQGRGGPEVVVDKKLCAEAANRLESLDKRWKITRLERDQARQMRERAERLLGLVRSAEVVSGTNYRKIKNMGPLHRTEWILKTVHPCECCDKQGVCGIPEDEVNDEYCAEHILLWLMQEAKDA